MSELISRKSVLDKIKKSLLIDELTVGEKAVLSDVATMISLEPTVDTRTPMDNIVEKLEENSFDMSLENPDCKAIWTDKAINIVKQEMGVINNEPTNN